MGSISGGGHRCALCLGICSGGAFPPTANTVTNARARLERALESKLGSCFHKVVGIYRDVFSYTTHHALCDESFLIFLLHLSRCVALRKSPTLSRPSFPHLAKVEKN